MTKTILVTIVWVALAACSSSSATASVSQVPAYVALVHSYWADLQAADGISGGVNVAAQSCLGSGGAGTELVDPPTCRGRAVALVAVQRKFLSDLATIAVPQRFADEDHTLRTKLPTVISDLEALIAACDTGSKDKVFAGAGTYVSDMIPDVTRALDTIDPSVVHD
jgi:hypothetical protein